MHCKNCGVELEKDMPVCPLCGEPVYGDGTAPRTAGAAYPERSAGLKPPLDKKQRKFTWEIITIILGAGIAATFAVDLIIGRSITWSEYTSAIGLVIFCYVSIFAFWDKNIFLEIATGFLLSSICLLTLDALTGGLHWALKLAIPLLLAINVITMLYIKVVRSSRHKGINLIAYAFAGAALLSLCTEIILSMFITGQWRLNWSVIVSACIAPVMLLLLFIHFRLRKGRNLHRTFHI